MKRVTKSLTDRKILGVCGGLGEYFGIDPTLIRAGFVVFGFAGAGVLAYIVLALIVPEQ